MQFLRSQYQWVCYSSGKGYYRGTYHSPDISHTAVEHSEKSNSLPNLKFQLLKFRSQKFQVNDISCNLDFYRCVHQCDLQRLIFNTFLTFLDLILDFNNERKKSFSSVFTSLNSSVSSRSSTFPEGTVVWGACITWYRWYSGRWSAKDRSVSQWRILSGISFQIIGNLNLYKTYV